MIFAVVTVLTVGAISIFYLRVPARLGIGAYEITANFVAGGGLYENANVTYRGVQAGRVEAVNLTDDGVAAHMRLNSDSRSRPTRPPRSRASRRSANNTSIWFRPTTHRRRCCATVPPSRRSGPRSRRTSPSCCSEADELVSSLNNTRLQDLLRETFKAFNGSGPELARLIQSSRLLIDEANASWPQTSALIDQAGPFLEAQIRSGDDIRSLADGLARLTTEVANADPQVRALLTDAPGAAAEANETFAGIRPSFPVLAANLANFGRIGVIYHRSIEQALVIFPALQAASPRSPASCPQTKAASRTSRSLSMTRPRATRILAADGASDAWGHDVAGTADGHVLQSGAERSDRGARREELSVPGVSR